MQELLSRSEQDAPLRIRVVGLPAKLLVLYRVVQVASLLSVFLFYDSVFQWMISRIGKTAIPILTGIMK